VLRVDRGRCTHHVAVALILVVALLSVACSAATPGALTPSAQDAGTDDVAPADAAPGAAEAGAAQTDWQHTLQVVANVRAQPPTQPVVYLLGGSVARECIPSEASWAVAVRAAGGPAAMTFDLASRNRTTAQDLKIVARLPEVPTILFIGVNVGRFTPAPSSPTLTLPAARQPLPPWKQHRYSTALSIAKKRALVSDWMQRRYPVFKKNYAYNLGMLEKLGGQGEGLPSRAAPPAAQHRRHRFRHGRPGRPLPAKLQGPGRRARDPLGRLRRGGEAEERRLLRPLAPHRERTPEVAAAAGGQDGDPAPQVRHGRLPVALPVAV
jgi:hypothetical protein